MTAGLIAVTTLTLARSAISDWRAGVIFAAAWVVIYRWKSKLAIPAIILGPGPMGSLWFD